jgi:hypothetical protein
MIHRCVTHLYFQFIVDQKKASAKKGGIENKLWLLFYFYSFHY